MLFLSNSKTGTLVISMDLCVDIGEVIASGLHQAEI